MSPTATKLAQAGAFGLLPASIIVTLFSTAVRIESATGGPITYQYAVLGQQVSQMGYWLEEGLSLAGITLGFACVLVLLYQRLALRARKIADLELNSGLQSEPRR